MKKPISTSRKSAGRPRKVGGAEPVSAVRLAADLTGEIDRWAEQHEIGRSEAIRRLVEIGLRAEGPVRTPPGRSVRSSRAAELAAKAIEKMIDPAAPLEEREQRRRRLTKGPPEFQDDRVDLPKRRR